MLISLLFEAATVKRSLKSFAVCSLKRYSISMLTRQRQKWQQVIDGALQHNSTKQNGVLFCASLLLLASIAISQSAAHNISCISRHPSSSVSSFLSETWDKTDLIRPLRAQQSFATRLLQWTLDTGLSNYAIAILLPKILFLFVFLLCTCVFRHIVGASKDPILI